MGVKKASAQAHLIEGFVTESKFAGIFSHYARVRHELDKNHQGSFQISPMTASNPPFPVPIIESDSPRSQTTPSEVTHLARTAVTPSTDIQEQRVEKTKQQLADQRRANHGRTAATGQSEGQHALGKRAVLISAHAGPDCHRQVAGGGRIRRCRVPCCLR